MTEQTRDSLANGSGAAAMAAAGCGGFALGVFALAGDAVPAVARLCTIWTPTGPLSGVTTGAITVWLLIWLVLARLWRGRTLDMRAVGGLVIFLMVAGLLLTFPPVMDFLQGK